MKRAPAHLIYESAFGGNIIPLTSGCNISCVFCSHRQNPPGVQILIPVQNVFFGGSIKSAGLLQVSDFIAAFKAGCCDKPTQAGRIGGAEAILVPAASFDRAGLDLTGTSYLKLQEATGLAVEII